MRELTRGIAKRKTTLMAEYTNFIFNSTIGSIRFSNPQGIMLLLTQERCDFSGECEKLRKTTGPGPWARSTGPIPRLGYRKNIEKCTKIMEYGMNQGLVCLFGLKLCQDVATGSPNPLEPFPTPKTPKNRKNPRISDFSPLPPPPLIACDSPLGLL